MCVCVCVMRACVRLSCTHVCMSAHRVIVSNALYKCYVLLFIYTWDTQAYILQATPGTEAYILQATLDSTLSVYSPLGYPHAGLI